MFNKKYKLRRKVAGVSFRVFFIDFSVPYYLVDLQTRFIFIYIEQPLLLSLALTKIKTQLYLAFGSEGKKFKILRNVLYNFVRLRRYLSLNVRFSDPSPQTQSNRSIKNCNVF